MFDDVRLQALNLIKTDDEEIGETSQSERVQGSITANTGEVAQAQPLKFKLSPLVSWW
jgi:hypothetical protein